MLVARKNVEIMNPELQKLSDVFREQRGFDANKCLQQKIELINVYFRENKLSGAIVGVSGGIDSAVVLGLIKLASSVPDSPINRIVAASIPFSVAQGASNQDVATDRGVEVARKFKVQYVCTDLGDTFRSARKAVCSELGVEGNAWADGQLVAYLRTPALYYLSALLTSTGTPAIVCGTTNRDEGSYLGFFGKASDGMVDLQVISDLHKSEVYALGKLLGVPSETLEAAPTGDVFDGKTHLEMIGAPYDFVELYMNWLCLKLEDRVSSLANLSSAAKEQFEMWAERIESMHSYNAHKYFGGNPSVHLDILQRAVPGGWKSDGVFKPSKVRSLVGEFSLSALALNKFDNFPRISPQKTELESLGGSALVIDKLLTPEEANVLYNEVAAQKRLPVGTNGILKDFQQGKDKLGSFRATAFCPELAEKLWDRIKPFIESERVFDEYASSDWCSHKKWKPIGINPAFRYIWYEKGGELVVHYDAGYNPGDGKTHSLMSVVLYLNDCDPKSGGSTRFIKDSQIYIPYAERDFSDWKREANADEVMLSIEAQKGRALIFDHRLLHDSEPWAGNSPKVIIRTDIMFERCED